MAPCPEEVDVFTIPHSRMKELVCKYLDMLTATNFADVVHLTALLENLIRTFQEFIAHEQIENQFIMKKLKNKLRSLSIQNTAVCNCHKDNRLETMLKFLQDGYKCTKKSELDRNNYGLQLRQELEDFTETFLPHMEEEEEVFQPLLMQHFTYEELKQIKATVLQQHFKMETEDIPEKFVADNRSCKSDMSMNSSSLSATVGIENLPDEVMLKIFSHLNPQALCRSAQVSHKWNSLAMDGSLWTRLYPVSWAKGNWDARGGVYEEDSIDVKERLNAKSYDEDADVDETDEWDTEAIEIQRQSSMLTSMCKHLLPRVGRTIKHCDLAYSKGLTNGALYKVLSLCPNLEYLDLTHTRVSDLGFKGFKKGCSGKKLRHLDLSGCLYITDQTLQRLSSALGQIPCHGNETKDTDHVTNSTNETVSDEQGCTSCEEKRKIGRNKSEKQEKKLNSCQMMSSNKGMDSLSRRKQFMQGEEGNTSQCSGISKDCDGAGRLAPDNGIAYNCTSKGDDKDFEDSTSDFKRTRNKNGCCYSDDDDMPVSNEETPHVADTDETHNQKLDNENTDTQDRSWIKGHTNQASMTVNGDLSRKENDKDTGGNDVIFHQTTTQRQDQKNIRNLNSSTDCEVEIVPNNEIIETESNPEQTYLPDFFLHPYLRSERDFDPEVDVKPVLPVETNGLKSDFEVSEDSDRALEFLSLSGCYQITDEGLDYLTSNGGLPRLKYLDLSGCLNVNGEAVSDLVNTALHLDPTQLFYCDNILDGPYADTASGCQNLQCNSRVCCRCGE